MKVFTAGHNRHVCTPEDPWDESKGPGIHPDTVEVGDGTVYCPNCGVEGSEVEKVEKLKL